MTGSTRGGRGRRGGSRLLLAAALLLGVAVSLYTGALLADLLSDLAGITSGALRLVLKVLFVAAVLPAGFYLVERIFLKKVRGQ